MNTFFKTLVIAGVAPLLLIGAQSPNPRGNISQKNIRAQEIANNTALRRSATSVIARNVVSNNRQNRTVVTARPMANKNVKVRSVRPVVNNGIKSRVAGQPSLVRSGVSVKKNSPNVSRAGTARATAVFNDISKIGGGYSDCRDSYATCMDQMCANANDTYRRCFCSDRFTAFRETADKLDAALGLLADFQDNNLNAVDKTAAEVNAMYTATAGEAAIKRDTSASQKLLDSISDVLSGKTSTQTPKQNLTSLGVLDLSGFGDNSDDVFGGNSLFGGGDSANLADLEGKALYNAAAKQCAEISRNACGSDAMFNLAKSAYSIMITQDCNAYEKNINAKKASVEETVRTAEKYLREARLEEYRSHNSADVNECLSKVETALRQPTACGADYEKCMDYTGLYINASTGEPIYSQALFGLNTLIVLDGTADVLGANPEFDKMLENKKMFATTALDSCRDLSDTVWYEFKRSALIQIAQAQDEKIQQVKDSCVTTIKECYDTQSGALTEMDTTQMQSTGAIAAVTARGMCYDRVQACAALYGDPDGCEYDDETKKLTAKNGKKCGLQSLLTFVDTVDSVKVAEGCETALTKYAHELCDEDIGTENSIPYGKCAKGSVNRAQLRAAMESRRKTFCAADLVSNDETKDTKDENDAFNTNLMNQIIKDIYDEIGIAFTAGCESENGTWVFANELSNPQPSALKQEFYQKYYGTTVTNISQIGDFGLKELGFCINASVQTQCEALGNYAHYDENSADCILQPAWYQDTCTDVLGGVWNSATNVCDIDYQNDDAPDNTSNDRQNFTHNMTNSNPTQKLLQIANQPSGISLQKIQKTNNVGALTFTSDKQF